MQESALSEFQQRACAVAVVKMLQGKHFSICDLDSIAKTMGPELARLTREKCLELLGLPPQTIELVQQEHPREKPTEPAKRLRLAFWR